jgi:solute carrier family 25 (mitochondrial adenine nucleotide translocator), member 4/5/6/31
MGPTDQTSVGTASVVIVGDSSCAEKDLKVATASTDLRATVTTTTPATRPQWREAVAGACAGAFSRTLLAPVERIKLIKQLQGSVVSSGGRTSTAVGSSSSSSSATLAQLSAWQVAHQIYRHEGILAFWRGNWPNVIRVSGTSALHFTCMDYFKRAAVAPIVEQTLLANRRISPSALERRRKMVTSFISGGLAGAAATTLLYPVEFLRTRLAMDLGRDGTARQSGSTTDASIQSQRRYRGMMDVLRDIWRSDGVLGLYQGYGIALVGGVVYRVILLGGYDACKYDLLYRKMERARLQPQGHNNSATNDAMIASLELSWGERILVAQSVSLIAGTLTYPFDSVRRRLMMEAGLAQRTYRNSWHCTRIMWRQEGIRGFYLGLGPNLIRSVGTALLLVGYDRIRSLL